MLTGLALGIGGWFLGGWIGGQLAVGHDYLLGSDQNDAGIFLGYIFAVLGWLVGLGFANYPIARLRGRPLSLSEQEGGTWTRYFRPLVVGARRMAFPRIEALTFWLVPAAGLILMSAIAFGGLPFGWTGYAPLADQGRAGIDAYVMAFVLIAISLTLVGINLLVT